MGLFVLSDNIAALGAIMRRRMLTYSMLSYSLCSQLSWQLPWQLHKNMEFSA